MDGRVSSDMVVEPMMIWKGEVVTIQEIVCDKYEIKEQSGWNWTDGMFLGLARKCELSDVSDLI